MKFDLTQFELSRAYWDYAFEHPTRVKPVHSAIFFFAVEHCNRLGWKRVYGFPTSMAKEATGISSYNTYIAALRDLVEWGFITVHEWSKNQYSSNRIELSIPKNALSKNDKALDKALTKHHIKHHESTVQSNTQSNVQSIDSIDKPVTIEPVTREPHAHRASSPSSSRTIEIHSTERPTLGGGGDIELLDPDLIDRVPAYGKIRIHQQGLGLKFDERSAASVVSRIRVYLDAKQGRGTYDDQDIYELYELLWQSDHWHMRSNPSLETLDKKFNAIIGGLANKQKPKHQPRYSADQIAEEVARQMR